MWSYLLACGKGSRNVALATLASLGLTTACSDAPAESAAGLGHAGSASSAGSGASTPPSGAGASAATHGGSSGVGVGGSGSGSGSASGGSPGSGGVTVGAAAGTGSSPSGGSSAAGSGAGGESELDNPLGAPLAFITDCAVCHGVDAKGTTKGPESWHAPPELVDYYVRGGDNNIWTGCDVNKPSSDRPCSSWGDQRIMTAFPASALSDADLTAITAWLDGLPKPTTGDALYADYCSSCHGPGGDIPTFTYYVKSSAPVQGADLAAFRTTVKQGLTANRQIDERSRYMPPFGSLLTDAEITLVARWMCTQTFSKLPLFCGEL
jgi:mono/diheme cytochrome c family protein